MQLSQLPLVEGESKQPIATALHREYIKNSRRVEMEQEDAKLQLRSLTPQQVKNRQAILNKVRKFWVEGVLETSLHDQVLIELGLEERADAVVSSQNIELETADKAQKTLPKGTKVISIFDQLSEGRTLLILGEPGAGKTTTLLELTRDLVDRAEQSLDYHIPIVLNLSSWAGNKVTITDWLVEELNSKYQVPKPIGQNWVKKQELLLLLDGLDEVKVEHRSSCVAALNYFQQDYSSKMVVSCRMKYYERHYNRLNSQHTIYLRALTLEQARCYLDNIPTDLTGLRASINKNTALQKLAKSPLMLSIMALAYEGVAVENLPKTEVVEQWRKQLFDAYIKQMFRRPSSLNVEQKYLEAQSIHWLTLLAQRMVQESETVFFIERMQPTWLPTKYTKYKKILYKLAIFFTGWLILWIIVSLMVLLISKLNDGIFYVMSLWLWRNNGMNLGLILGLISAWGNPEIKTVGSLKWSWTAATNNLFKGWVIGATIGLLIGLSNNLAVGLISASILGLFFGIYFSLIGGRKYSTIATETIPNQGIYTTATNAGIIGLTYGLIFWLISGLILTGIYRNGIISGLTSGLSYGLTIGAIAAILGGGKACIQHLTLRLILYHNGYSPWNYARFLDYAAERILLQKVGGGYIFIHRLLLEHFAQRKLES